MGRKGQAPFSAASGGFGRSGCFCQGAGLKSSDRVPPLLRLGFAFLRLRALAGSWSRILSVVRPGRDSSLILFRDSPPPLSRPDIVSDVRTVSPRSLALGVLSLSALEIILSQDHCFSINLFLAEMIAIACCP